MNPVTENFVKQHQKYLSDNPNELEKFGSVYDHMLFYLTSILSIDEKQALQCILDLKADISCDHLPYIVKSEII